MNDKIEQLIAEHVLKAQHSGKRVAEEINAYRTELQQGAPSFQGTRKLLRYLLSYANATHQTRVHTEQFAREFLGEVSQAVESVIGQLVPVVNFETDGSQNYFTAKHPDFEGIEGSGGSYHEAVENFYDNLEAARDNPEQP